MFSGKKWPKIDGYLGYFTLLIGVITYNPMNNWIRGHYLLVVRLGDVRLGDSSVKNTRV